LASKTSSSIVFLIATLKSNPSVRNLPLSNSVILYQKKKRIEKKRKKEKKRKEKKRKEKKRKPRNYVIKKNDN